VQPEPRAIRVLVVDDEPVLRTMLRRMLAKAGFEVMLAESGEAALELLEGGADADLLLSDVRMPGLTGPQLAARLAQRDPPVVVFMSGASDHSPDALRAAGGRGFIKKPFRLAELLDVIHTSLPH
jgi:CheY-like chemotaxis protein